MLRRRPALTPIGMNIGRSADEIRSAAVKKYNVKAQQVRCEAQCLEALVSLVPCVSPELRNLEAYFTNAPGLKRFRYRHRDNANPQPV
jgi:hypothetical protein